MSLSSFSVKNAVLVNMITVVVFIFGIYTANTIPKEEMPAVDFGSFVIVTAYPGVSPDQIENLIINPIEKEVSKVENIDYISSSASEGRAVTFVSMLPGADIDKAWTDINTELDKVTNLPEDATDPIIVKLNMREINPICVLSLSGKFDPLKLKDIGENLKDEILQLDYISKVDITGAPEREIVIECDYSKLEQYNISLNDISRMVAARNRKIPAGTAKEGNSEFIVSASGQYDTVADIESTPIKTESNQSIIRLSNIAAVKDTLKEQNVYSRLNGSPGIFLYVYKKADGNIISVIEEIKNTLNTYKSNVNGLDAALRNDGSLGVKRSISALSGNAMQSIVLVFLTLMLFIGWRSAILAAMGIPFAFLMTFAIMNYFGVTMNSLTLFALVLVSGMIVDDAIVILENTHRYREMGFSLKEAVTKGTDNIMWPVISSVLTTVAAFIPMVLMEGMMGKFMMYFPIVVSIALISSLFEALVILPSHIADFTEGEKVRKDLNAGWFYKLQCLYRRFLVKSLKHRYITMFTITTMFILSIGALFSGLIRFEFFPPAKPQTIVLRLELPTGTQLDKTAEVTDRIEAYVKNIKQKEDIVSIISTVGQMEKNHRQDQNTNYSELRIDLVSQDDMKYSNEDIKAEIRKFMNEIPEVRSYEFGSVTAGPPTGKDIELRFKGDDYAVLEDITAQYAEALSTVPGVTAVSDNYNIGKEELKIKINSEKASFHGITVIDIASFLRTSLTGTIISQYIENNEEFDIRLKIKTSQAKELKDLEMLNIMSPKGYRVPLKDIVDFSYEPGIAQINHWNKKRTISLTAETTFYDENGQKKKRSPNEVNEILFGSKIKGIEGLSKNIISKYPGYTVESGGVAEQQRKSFSSLYLAFLIAILLVFTILAAQFKSYVQPIIVMLTIPFAFIGVVIGLIVMDLPFSLNTLIAVIALAGIVVNNSIVLVDFVNESRDEGVDRWNSLIHAGVSRLRPIILTTVTTVFGLMPFILSTSSASKDWKPMAVSIVFGLSFATIVSLIIIPVVYSFVDSFFGKLKMTRFKEHIPFEVAVKDECK